MLTNHSLVANVANMKYGRLKIKNGITKKQRVISTQLPLNAMHVAVAKKTGIIQYEIASETQQVFAVDPDKKAKPLRPGLND
jgi:hypothetical protein